MKTIVDNKINFPPKKINVITTSDRLKLATLISVVGRD